MQVNFNELVGNTIIRIEGAVGDKQIMLTTDTGDRYRMYHDQDCCESVHVEDIIGDVNDLIGSPILKADEICSSDKQEWEQDEECEPESFTWAFYHLATIKGYVTIRWYGSSNGYYSESVTIEKD